jgi:hypothetical protein
MVSQIIQGDDLPFLDGWSLVSEITVILNSFGA